MSAVDPAETIDDRGGRVTSVGVRRVRPHRRSPGAVAAVAAVAVLGAIAAFAAYLRLASTRAVNSDGSSSALQAWDMLHGNALLHGWTLGDASFYLTELPEYLLIEAARGLNQNVVHIAAALTYTLAVVAAAMLAKARATGREALVRVLLAIGIMLAPQLGTGTDLFLSSPDHFGTSVPIMATWLILDRARPRWYVPVITSVLLAWAEVGDMLVLTIGVLPLVIVCGLRVARAVAINREPLRDQWYDIALAGGAVVAAAVGAGVLIGVHDLGGFYAVVPHLDLSPAGTIVGTNARVTGEGLLLLAGADFLGLGTGAVTFFTVLHVAGIVLGACAIVMAAWRFARDDDLPAQLLLVGIVITVGSYLVSLRGGSILYAHDMAPVLPFAAALAGRLVGGRVLTMRLRQVLVPVLAVVFCGYLAGLGWELSHPSAPAQNQQLTSWLRAHHLRAGLSGYWASSVVTVTSGGQVSIRPVQAQGGRVVPKATLVKAAWYDPKQSSANFVVLFPGIPVYSGFTDRAAVIATFGDPAHAYRVGQYTILVWDKNLLADLPAAGQP
jgi:hypothetical protein